MKLYSGWALSILSCLKNANMYVYVCNWEQSTLKSRPNNSTQADVQSTSQISTTNPMAPATPQRHQHKIPPRANKKKGGKEKKKQSTHNSLTLHLRRCKSLINHCNSLFAPRQHHDRHRWPSKTGEISSPVCNVQRELGIGTRCDFKCP